LSQVVHSDSELDTQGLLCPEPLMLLRNHMRELDAGEILYITASDPTTHRDFSNFCHFMGHELLAAEVDGEILQYWVKKGSA